MKTGSTIAVAGTVSLVGCKQIERITKPNEKQELLEAELRTRDREVNELRAENQQLRQLTDIYTRQGAGGSHEVITGPLMTAPDGQVVGASKPTSLASSVSLGTGTGGRDDDGLPGDEILQVVIVPKDNDGSAIKIPGRATVQAIEFTKEGLKLPIGTWEVGSEDLKRSWKGGLFGSGYFVPLMWDRAPTSDKVRVNIRFVGNDGQVLETDKDVNVKPLPGLRRATDGTPLIPTAPAVTVSGPVSVAAPTFGSSSTVLPPIGSTLNTRPQNSTILPMPSAILPLPEFPSSPTK